MIKKAKQEMSVRMTSGDTQAWLIKMHDKMLAMLKTVHMEGAGRYYEAIAELIKEAEGSK